MSGIQNDAVKTPSPLSRTRERVSTTPLGHVGQVGILVPEIATAVDTYSALFGIASWWRSTYGPGRVPTLMYRGQEGTFSMHIALGGERPQIELVQSRSGPSIYEEHLRLRGSGLHHLGVFVASLDDAIAKMEGLGFSVLQLGRGYGLDGDGGFAYFDTVSAFSIVIEAIEQPRRRAPSCTTDEVMTP